MDFDSWLKAKGFTDPLSDTQRAALLAAWKAEAAPPPEPKPKELDDVVAVAHADRERRQRVAEIVARVIEDRPEMLELAEALGRQAIEAKWTTDQLELHLLRASRPTGPALVIPRETQVNDKVIEAAVCQAAGGLDMEKHFDAPTLEAAHRKWKHGLGLQQVLLLCAQQGGYRGYDVRSDLPGVLRAAFTPRADVGVRAAPTGPSTYSLPNILGNIANKFVRVAFEAVDDAWMSIAAIRSVNDFKTITTVSLTGDLQYELVPPGGEINHGTVGEKAYTNRADTYGKMLGIDRRDLINDDVSALTRAATRLGRGGALKVNDVFWTAFLNNSSFFTSGNANVVTGATTAMDATNALEALRQADDKLRSQTDPDGKPLGLFASILLVPTARRIVALNAMNSTIVVAGGVTNTTTMSPNGNAFAGAYRVVSSPYMSNSSYTGNSNAAWYLLIDPQTLPVIEGAFLNGQRMPTVETTDADFNMLGIAMRGYHDFGFSLQEFRGGVRAAGA